MEIEKRLLDLKDLLSRKSFFLFGPRATGKSYLIREQLGEVAEVVNLLRVSTHLLLSANADALEEIVRESPKKILVIDEVQKLPALLDVVHNLIEERRITCLLTGSSARKLRNGQANLLAGRARTAELFPLVTAEIRNFHLLHYLRFGGLPPILLSKEPQEDLDAYVYTYLQEEIKAEGAVRKVGNFSRFLTVAAATNAQLLNFSAVASDAAVPETTVRDYFQILSDTLIGTVLEPWAGSKKRKAVSAGKFYFFDLGVWHTLRETQTLPRNSDLFGVSFEQFIFQELRAFLSYSRSSHKLRFWRSLQQHEVDFTLGDKVAVEVKAKTRISERDLRGLRALREEGRFQKFIVVSQDPTNREIDGVRALHWERFLKALWDGSIV